LKIEILEFQGFQRFQEFQEFQMEEGRWKMYNWF